VTVLDVSLHRNREALDALLLRGVAVEYFDHHHAGEVPVHPLLQAHLDAGPGVCTSLLVDRHLQGRHRRWAMVGAFGDNLGAVADALARREGLAAQEARTLRELGEAMNYNAYGDSEADLLVAPGDLARAVRPYADPLVFAAREPLADALVRQQAEDLARGLEIPVTQELPGARVFVLPDVPWARRVQGALANALSLQVPAKAHAVLREAPAAAYVVSVRAPQQGPRGADTLCLAFPGGGGRAGAAGIDALPRERIDEFIAAMARAYPAQA
jgi:hypothetical protein